MPHLAWISLHIHPCLRYTCSSIQSASPLTPLKCAALNSAALPWALQHLLVGKLPAVFSVPWKLMLWIMRFGRYLQVPWQIRVLDFLFFIFLPELVYEADFSAVFPLWILPTAVFVAGACARSSPNHLCLLASITVVFRANKQFYRA